MQCSATKTRLGHAPRDTRKMKQQPSNNFPGLTQETVNNYVVTYATVPNKPKRESTDVDDVITE